MAHKRDERWSRADREAAMWLEVLERTIKPSETAMLRTWLKSALHRDVILERCRLWHGPDMLATLGLLISTEKFVSRIERNSQYIVLAIFMAVSAMGLTTIFLAWSRLSSRESDPLRVEAVLQTDIGGLDSFVLADGTKLTLNTASRVLVLFGPNARDITLLQGEASFEVAPDAHRPFTVHAGSRSFVVASQTAHYQLRRRAESVELTVVDGSVAASESRQRASLTPALRRARVSSGPHTFKSGEGGLLGAGWYMAHSMAPAQLQRKQAWRSRRLIFEDEALEDALREIERYTHLRFEVVDERLRAIRLNAEISTDRVESVLDLLKAQHGVRVRTAADGTRWLSSSASKLTPPSAAPFRAAEPGSSP